MRLHVLSSMKTREYQTQTNNIQIDHYNCEQSVLDVVVRFHGRSCLTLDEKINGNLNFSSINRDDLSRLEFSETPLLPTKNSNIKVFTNIVLDHFIRNRSGLGFTKKQKIEFEVVKTLLQNSFGARSEQNPSRPYASAGALYPIETFVCIFEMGVKNGPNSGIYHYLPNSKALELIQELDEGNMVRAMGIDRNRLGFPYFAIVYFINIKRALGKYKYRGYRHGLMEAGSMYQQADIIAKALGLHTRLWSNFADYKVCKSFGINPLHFLPLTIQWFGLSDVK